MAKSKDTFNKKEKEKLRQKKKQEKLDRKEARKSQTNKSTDFEDMLAYVDEFGNIVSTPPDPSKKKEVDADSIDIGIPKADAENPEDNTRKGRVTFFNHNKGYGFIKDAQTQESVFVHVHQCLEEIQEGDMVNYTTEKGPKGLSAVGVKKA